MRIDFAQPLFLLLLIPLGLHVIWMGRRLALMSRARRVTAVTLRLLVLALLLAALAGARVARQSRDLTVFFLVDESESVPEAQREYGRAFVQTALGRMNPRADKAGIIMFGADAAVEQGPDAQPEFEKPASVVDRTRTNLADAIQLAMACFVGQSQKRIVILSDGNQNVGDAVERARSAAAANIAIDVVPLIYENRNDVILEKAIVENRVSLEEPFDIRVIASARQATTGKLSVYLDGRLIGHDDVTLQPDKKNAFLIPTELRDPGFHRFEVQLEAAGDSIPENNRAFAFTYGEGEPRVLLVDGDDNPSPVLPSMLLSENIRVEVTDPSGIPQDLNQLQNFDGLILNNVAAGEMTRQQMRTIERAVADLGLGFMMIGGENSFGAGGYNDSPIEEILPVEMEIKNEKVMPQGALVPIVHTVEIPQGQYWAEQIMLAALDVLTPRDLMGVLIYGYPDGESWLFPLQEVAGKEHLKAKIKGVPMGDMPSFDATLQMAYDGLVASTASVKHIIVISDGDPATPDNVLAMNIRRAGITISTVCINPHSPRDTQVMRDLAKWGGGNFYNPTSYNTLPQIFIKEATTVRKSLIIEEPFTPVITQYSPLLTGVGDAYPQLRGYVGTTGKDLADVPLKTDKEDPLLAHWRHGLGKTVAFTSDAKERWASAWTTWGQYAKFWSQTVRWCLRQPFNRNYQVQMDIDGTQGKIIVDAVDEKGEFRNFLQIGGNLITPELKEKEITFRQVSPGRYESEFEADQPGTYMFGATATQAAGEGETTGGDLITGGSTLSYSPEFQQSRSNIALLAQLADVTKGRTLDEKSDVFRHDQKSYHEPKPLWPTLATILLFLFLMDVFVRRVMVGWGEIGAGLAFAGRWAGGRIFGRRAAASGPTDQLLEVKKGIRQQEEQPAATREEFLASLQQVKVEKSPLAPPVQTRPAPIAGGEEKPGQTPTPGGQPSSYTSELLKARGRAKSRFGKSPGGSTDPDHDKPSGGDASP